LRVGIQGLGATGADLAQRLHDAGAQLVVTDIDENRVKDIVARFGASPVAPNEIHAADVDVFAPCAMGAILNDQTIPEIKAKIICGLANNQLAEDHHGDALSERNITYVPDYVVNAGGMIGASTVIYKPDDRFNTEDQILALFDTITSIINRANDESRSTAIVADELAKKIMTSERGV